MGTFAYPIVTDGFLPESDIIPTPRSLKNLTPNLDSAFSYHQFNEAVSTYLCRTKLVVFINKLMPLGWDLNVLVVYMVERVPQHTFHVPSP